MNENTSAFVVGFGGDASLRTLAAALAPLRDKELVLDYGGHLIRPGYHVTEVKAGSFVTLDCGGNPDAWQETILQVEDLGPEGVEDYLSVGKFLEILDQVGKKVVLDASARLTFEVSRPDAAMQVFDVNTLSVEQSRVVLSLVARPAICKPRHRARQTTSCCGVE